MPKQFHVKSDGAGTRLDKWVSTECDALSRAHIKRLIESGHITLNGEATKAGYILKEEDIIRIDEPEEKTIDLTPKTVAFNVVYEDPHLLVINKPSGLVVHPSKTYTAPTLVHGLLDRIASPDAFDAPERAGIVHRLDKDTSGLLVVAKTPSVLATLQEALKARNVKRTYMAITEGVIPHNKGTINAPIGRHKTKRKLMCVKTGGRESVTHFEVLERFAANTLVRCTLETGRTHQIRVHMQYITHPILGDRDYGRKKQDDPFNQYLHASTLEFTHPISGESMRFTVDPPEPFNAKLRALKTS